jgi:PAS domain-containing protein
VSWSSLVIQLALLGLVLWLLQRQIGRRLHAERQSLRSAARAASVLQTVREPIVLLDRDLRVQLHNPAFAELYGLQDERADGLLLENVGDGAWKDPCAPAPVRRAAARPRAVGLRARTAHRRWHGALHAAQRGACRCPTPMTKWCC